MQASAEARTEATSVVTTVQEAAEEAKREAEEKAKREAEEQARREAEEKAKREAEEQARREAEEQAMRKAEEQAKREAEEQARREAEEQAMRKAEEQTRREAEEQARREAEEKTRREAEEKAKREAEEKTKREAEEDKAKRQQQLEQQQQLLSSEAIASGKNAAKSQERPKMRRKSSSNARPQIEKAQQKFVTEITVHSAEAQTALQQCQTAFQQTLEANATTAQIQQVTKALSKASRAAGLVSKYPRLTTSVTKDAKGVQQLQEWAASARQLAEVAQSALIAAKATAEQATQSKSVSQKPNVAAVKAANFVQNLTTTDQRLNDPIQEHYFILYFAFHMNTDLSKDVVFKIGNAGQEFGTFCGVYTTHKDESQRKNNIMGLYKQKRSDENEVALVYNGEQDQYELRFFDKVKFYAKNQHMRGTEALLDEITSPDLKWCNSDTNDEAEYTRVQDANSAYRFTKGRFQVNALEILSIFTTTCKLTKGNDKQNMHDALHVMFELLEYFSMTSGIGMTTERLEDLLRLVRAFKFDVLLKKNFNYSENQKKVIDRFREVCASLDAQEPTSVRGKLFTKGIESLRAKKETFTSGQRIDNSSELSNALVNIFVRNATAIVDLTSQDELNETKKDIDNFELLLGPVDDVLSMKEGKSKKTILQNRLYFVLDGNHEEKQANLEKLVPLLTTTEEWKSALTSSEFRRQMLQKTTAQTQSLQLYRVVKGEADDRVAGDEVDEKHQKFLKRFVEEDANPDEITNPQTAAKMKKQVEADRSQEKQTATVVYQEIVKRLKSNKQKTSYMVVAMLYEYCDERYETLEEVEIDEHFRKYCSNYYNQFYEEPANNAPDALLIRFMQKFTTTVAALCCIQEVSKINSAERFHSKYRASVEYAAKNDSKVEHTGLQIEQNTQYEKLVRKIANTLYQEAEQDLQACVLYKSKILKKKDLLNMLKEPANEDESKANDVSEKGAAPRQLRPFANVRLRFI